MRAFCFVAAIATATSALLLAADWPMPGGGPQRNSWAKSERLIKKANVAHLQLLYKYRVDSTAKGVIALSAPIIDGNLITYLGFKEMLIFGASDNKVFSIDADLNKEIWASKLAVKTPPPDQGSAVCPGGLTSPVVMAGSSSTSLRFASEASRTPAVAGARKQRSPYFPPLSQTLYPLRPTTLTQLAALYTVSSDGYLHVLNSSTGSDLLPAIQFVPPHAKVSSLNVQENFIYATTDGNCDGYKNAVFGLDLLSNGKQVTSFVPEEGAFAGAGGTAIARDGTIYVQAMYEPPNGGRGAREALLALTPKELKVKDYFLMSSKRRGRTDARPARVTPVVLSSRGKEFIVAGGRDGRLYVLDAHSLGGADHMTPLFASRPIATSDPKHPDYGFGGTFASWLDSTNGSRWIYASLNGPAHAGFALPGATQKADKASFKGGSIVALKLTTKGEAPPVLEPEWISGDVSSPVATVVAGGMAFVLSSGERRDVAGPNGKRHSAAGQTADANAHLIVLDGSTGKELYTSGQSIDGASGPGDLAVANGRVYVTTKESTVYCFGLLQEQPQLSEQH